MMTDVLEDSFTQILVPQGIFQTSIFQRRTKPLQLKYFTLLSRTALHID